MLTQPQTYQTTKVGTNFVNGSGAPTSQTMGTGFVTAIETFTYHGDNDLMMNLNEANMQTMQDGRIVQIDTETNKKITFNTQIGGGSGLIRSKNNSHKKTSGSAIIGNNNSPGFHQFQTISLNRSTYQQQKEAMQRVNSKKLNGRNTM